MALQAADQLAGNGAHASFGVVDPTGMAIREDHARIDHRGQISWHHRPAEAFHVDELQQLWVMDVLARHIADVERQPAGQAEAGQWCAEEDLGQIRRILQREERHRIQAAEDLPARVVEGPNPLGFVGEQLAQACHETVVVAIDRHVEIAGQVIFQLHRIRHRLAMLADISQGSGQQVGVPVLAKAENHRGAHIKGVAGPLKAAATATGDQVALQHQHLGPFGRQLAGGDQTADARADDDHIPGWCGAHRTAAAGSATLGAGVC